jgi:acylphosphatase
VNPRRWPQSRSDAHGSVPQTPTSWGSRATPLIFRTLGEAGAGVVCRKCLVDGRVQGVFYRATAALRARELAICGYARNLPDGRVEVLACGDEMAVQAFVKWLWIGSSASKVTSVEVMEAVIEAAQVPTGFATA